MAPHKGNKKKHNLTGKSKDQKKNAKDVPQVDKKVLTKPKRRIEAVRKIVREVEELANVAESGPDSKFPFGHKGWLSGRKKQEQVKVSEAKLAKYSRGDKLNKKKINPKVLEKEKEIEYSLEQAARTEILLSERPGFLQTDDGEVSTQFSQKDIVQNVDITSATKHFELSLPDFGPYRINYTRNGRHLLIGGRKGHLAAFDWVRKKLACEINVMEEVFDVQWLHNELMFAVAQKKWVYIYDNHGVELHCVRHLNNVLRMEFLPYHFLLTTSNSNGYLSWLDVSMGKLVANYYTHRGYLNIMTQNPYNAVTCMGHSNGTVTMWSPTVTTPLISMLCHKKPLSSIAINSNGTYLATAAVDKNVNIWDLRNFKGPLQNYYMSNVVTQMSFSDNSTLAMSMGNVVEVYTNCCKSTATRAYLRYRTHRPVFDLQFCPYEDVLGIGSETGFTSVLVPGAGEPNFDALESNPFQTKKQRQEAEVKSLLEKIQPEFITLDPHAIGDIDVPTLKEKFEAKKMLALGKMPNYDFTPRKKARFRGNIRAIKSKKIVKEQVKRQYVKALKSVHDQEKTDAPEENPEQQSVLDRFKRKKKKK